MEQGQITMSDASKQHNDWHDENSDDELLLACLEAEAEELVDDIREMSKEIENMNETFDSDLLELDTDEETLYDMIHNLIS